MSATVYLQQFYTKWCHGNTELRRNLQPIPEQLDCSCRRPFCDIFDTCCPELTRMDYDFATMNRTVITLLNSFNKSRTYKYTTQENLPKILCETQRSSSHVLTIRSCPDNYTGPASVVELCEVDIPREMMTLDVYNFVVDMETELLFYNKYCAECNGYTQVRPIGDFEVYCTDYQSMHKAMDYDEVINISLRDPSCALRQKLDNVTFARCIPDKYTIARCNELPSNRPYDKDVERACLEFNNTADLVFVDKMQTFFRNIFCYICNTNINEGEWKEPPKNCSILKVPPPFSQLIRFTSPATNHDTSTRLSNQSLCNDKHWPTPDGVCKPLHCTTGKILTSGRCKTFNTKVTGLFYRLRTWFMLEPADFNLDFNSLRHILTSFIYETKEMHRLRGMSYSMNLDSVISIRGEKTKGYRIQSPLIVLADVFIVAPMEESRDEIEEFLVNTFLRHPLIVGDVHFISYLWLGDFVYLSLYEWCRSKLKHCFTYPFNDVTLLTYNLLDRKDSLINVTNTLKCSFVSFNQSEFVVNVVNTNFPPTVTVSVNLRNTKLIFSTVSEINMLEIDGDGVLNVCRELLDEKLASLAKTPNELNYYANILTLNCMSASMLCLLVSLVTYIRFSVLRNSAGKNNMFMCTSLLLAQASLLASSYFSGYKNICIALGISTHFLWLWNFAWTFMCNFRILQVFSSQVRIPQTPDDERRVLMKNTIITIVLPIISVTAVVISSQILTHGQKIGYGEISCSIDSSILLGLCLVTPLALITVCNVAFFIATVVRIYTINRSVTQQNNFSTSDRQLSVVYVKLSLMTGAFWLFAIVGEATGSKPLQFVSILLNGLQGVFFFAACMCNRRVVRLYWPSIGQRGDTAVTCD